ncbi:Dual specificity protein phosphatase 22 [Eumeta japonica]|uniref:Dual specificity protein phosphatase 22 n=1 Tax=Eumeta variegata TaxID=151549 RepID=A0A4C1WJM3_EUMVA|nr:Dual specificity protein phosphatase 22 [Eumeta japonica]
MNCYAENLRRAQKTGFAPAAGTMGPRRARPESRCTRSDLSSAAPVFSCDRGRADRYGQEVARHSTPSRLPPPIEVVLSGLYVGNYRDSKDTVQLERYKITHILSIHDAARRLHSGRRIRKFTDLADVSLDVTLNKFNVKTWMYQRSSAASSKAITKTGRRSVEVDSDKLQLEAGRSEKGGQRELQECYQDLLANDVQVSNVSEIPGENPTHLAILIGVKLGLELDERDVVSTTRVGVRREEEGTTGRPRPIKIRLARRAIRDSCCAWPACAARLSLLLWACRIILVDFTSTNVLPESTGSFSGWLANDLGRRVGNTSGRGNVERWPDRRMGLLCTGYEGIQTLIVFLVSGTYPYYVTNSQGLQITTLGQGLNASRAFSEMYSKIMARSVQHFFKLTDCNTNVNVPGGQLIQN